VVNILAVDPGKRTGLATWSNGHFEAWDVDGWPDAVNYITTAVPHEFGSGIDLLVCESIVITAQTAKKSQDVLTSVEQIGVCRYVSMKHGVEFQLQSPGEAKSFGTDAKLRAMSMWTEGSDHARDATRHLILALARRDEKFLNRLSQAL
jgi:hypothetical protein